MAGEHTPYPSRTIVSGLALFKANGEHVYLDETNAQILWANIGVADRLFAWAQDHKDLLPPDLAQDIRGVAERTITWEPLRTQNGHIRARAETVRSIL